MEIDVTGKVSEDRTRPRGGRPDCFSGLLQECIFVWTATMAIGQTSFFSGVVLVLNATIGRELNMSSAEVTWITAGMSLTSGAFLLPFGKLSDLFGRKVLYISAMAGFTLTLVTIGFAPSAIYMDVFSGILGLFSAAVVPPATGGLGAVYKEPSKRKNRAFACLSAGNPLGFVGGMIISGIAAQVASWRASFWALAVVYAGFTALALWSVPSERPDSTAQWSWSFLQRCDPLGMLLVVVGVGVSSASLSLADDAPQGWRTPYVLSLLLIGLVSLALFLWWETMCGHPLLPLHVWRDRTFSVLLIIMALGWMGFMTVHFWMALWMQNGLHLSSLNVMVRMLPLAINGVLVNIVCALILHKVSNQLLVLIGAVAYTAAFMFASFTTEDSSYWAFYFPPMMLMVVGADIQFNVANLYVMSSFHVADQSLAGGIFNTITKLSSVIALSVSTAIHGSVRDERGIKPTLATYWFSAGLAGLSIFLVPFLRLGAQGKIETGSSG